MKNKTGVVLKLSLNMVDDDETNFPHKLLLTNRTTLIIPNDKKKDIIKILKSLEDIGFLLKGVRETIQNQAKEQKGGFFSMLLGMLGANLLGNILAGKEWINRAGGGEIGKRQGRGIVRAGYGNKKVRKATAKSKTDFKCRLIL